MSHVTVSPPVAGAGPRAVAALALLALRANPDALRLPPDPLHDRVGCRIRSHPVRFTLPRHPPAESRIPMSKEQVCPRQ
jgi:hypothetical protein